MVVAPESFAIKARKVAEYVGRFSKFFFFYIILLGLARVAGVDNLISEYFIALIGYTIGDFGLAWLWNKAVKTYKEFRG